MPDPVLIVLRLLMNAANDNDNNAEEQQRRGTTTIPMRSRRPALKKRIVARAVRWPTETEAFWRYCA